MRKFFGRDKPKVARVIPVPREIVTGFPSNYSEDGHFASQPHPAQRTGPPAFDRARYERRRSLSEEHWEEVVPESQYDDSVQSHHRRDSVSRSSSFISLPPGASPPTSSPLPRSSSPFSVASHPSTQLRDSDREAITLRKKPPGASVAALGILKALEPQNDAVAQLRSRSEEHLTIPSEPMFKSKREKRSFWERTTAKEKDKDQEKDRGKDRERKDEESQAELTKMIGYLTATSSEDWSLVLEVCERASANENNAREAVRALRREFKYGEPSAQLSAARLWAIMLRNSNETFIAQSTSRKFLDSIEEILMSARTAPVVRERLMDVVAAAAFASNAKAKDTRGDKEGFRGLWKRVKPVEKPDEVRGFYLVTIFLTDSLGGIQGVPFDTHDSMFNPPASRHSPYANDLPFRSAQDLPPSPNPAQILDRGRKHKPSSARDGVIPLKEDIRRLFQECKIGQGNASLLSEALAFAKPEDLSKDIIREFYAKCRSSQELICAQIPWATAGAERSRLARVHPGKLKSQSLSHGEELPKNDEPIMLTTEEKLLDALLAANEALLEALRVHGDLESMALEKRAEERSRQETRISQTHADVANEQGLVGADDGIRITGPVLSAPSQVPRLLLTSSPPRTPSPVMSDHHSPPTSPENEQGQSPSDSDVAEARNGLSDDEDGPAFDEPSAKALGKRRVVEADEIFTRRPGEDAAYDINDFYDRPDARDYESDGRWRRDVQYVYDAAAERTRQRIRDGHLIDVNIGP